MVILTTDNGTIKTIPIDVEPELDGHDVQKQVGILNKRLSGKTLRAAQDELKHFIAEIKQANKPIYRLLVEIEHKVFNFNRYDGYRLTGTRNILAKPEFSDIQRVSTLMDLLEDREIIIHFLGQREVPPGVRITIGSEHRESRIQACTVITSTYKLGQTS